MDVMQLRRNLMMQEQNVPVDNDILHYLSRTRAELDSNGTKSSVPIDTTVYYCAFGGKYYLKYTDDTYMGIIDNAITIKSTYVNDTFGITFLVPVETGETYRFSGNFTNCQIRYIPCDSEGNFIGAGGTMSSDADYTATYYAYQFDYVLFVFFKIDKDLEMTASNVTLTKVS